MTISRVKFPWPPFFRIFIFFDEVFNTVCGTTYLMRDDRLRPLLIHLVLPSGRPPLYAADESCSDRRWLLAFCCVARYYFPRLSRRVGGGAHRASEGSWSSWTSSTSWSS